MSVLMDYSRAFGALKTANYIVLYLFLQFVSSEDVATNTTGPGTYCAYVNNKVSTERDTGDPIIVTNPDLQTSTEQLSVIRCHREHEFCFTLFHIDPVDKERHTILMQGCWDHPDNDACPETDCVARSPLSHKHIRNNTRFCCCRGFLCNVNVTDTVNLTAINIMIQQAQTVHILPYPNMNVVIITVVGVGVLITLIAGFVFIRFWFIHKHRKSCMEHGNESDAFLGGGSDTMSGASSCGSELDGLKFDVLVSRGKYGEVYRGLLGPSEVAVKILNTTQYRCYANERDILSMLSVRHPGVVEFRGCREERLPVGSLRYLVVTTFEPLGSLMDYFKQHTIDWVTSCRMCHSLAAGLAHLHTESSDGGLTKPSIVHRDVNSRNVLVRSDLTLCLCDFGFAMKIASPRFNEAGTSTTEDHASLADVGTLRYMAPEVLEGSVNLCDCRMALTQVDVYALGLVFWEIGTRCHDLYQGLPTPAYQLPFESQLGSHPTFEDMQVAVARNKQRPVFPDTWKDTNVAIKALKDTIEECWDHDAEARISSVCAEERTREMASLWETRHKGLTPTAVLKDLEERALVQHNITSTITAVDGLCAAPSGDTVDSCAVETLVGKADCNVALALSGGVAPPRALRNAQNPTVERNTHWSSSEELAVEGNTLVVRRPCGTRETALDASTSSNDNAPPGRNIHQSAPRAGRPVSVLRSGPQHNRISFVQNPVEAAANPLPSGSGGPKRQNVPGNGRSDHVDTAAGKSSPARHQCAVVLVDGVANSTVVRPSTLPVEASQHGAGRNQSTGSEQATEIAAPVQTEMSAADGGVLYDSNRDLGPHPSTVDSTHDVVDEPSSLNSSHVVETRSTQQPFSDNLGFEASTSPRFDDPCVSRRVW